MFCYANSIMRTALQGIWLCGGQNGSPGSVHVLIPGHYGYVTLRGKKDRVDVITLRWEDYPELSGAPNVITRVLKMRGMKMKSKWGSREGLDPPLLALKMGEGDVSQGMLRASSCQKGQGNGLFPRTFRKQCHLATSLTLTHWDLCWTSILWKCKMMDFYATPSIRFIFFWSNGQRIQALPQVFSYLILKSIS